MIHAIPPPYPPANTIVVVTIAPSAQWDPFKLYEKKNKQRSNITTIISISDWLVYISVRVCCVCGLYAFFCNLNQKPTVCALFYYIFVCCVRWARLRETQNPHTHTPTDQTKKIDPYFYFYCHKTTIKVSNLLSVTLLIPSVCVCGALRAHFRLYTLFDYDL